MAELRSQRKRQRCPHCDELLGYKSFLSHKRRYYDPSNDSWIKDVKTEDLLGKFITVLSRVSATIY